MAAEKKICCIIMLCQMTAILSGVAIMYLSVIVVIPSKNELAMNFVDDPVMCTTTQAINIAAGGKKVDCLWSTCGEWCLSKASSPCMQIYAMPRNKGSRVELQECEIFMKEPCSALDVEKTNEVLCKQGECQDITGLFNCSKYGENSCREITPAYKCPSGKLNSQTIICEEEKCTKRLSGVFHCASGKCNRLDRINDYTDCERKCEDLDLSPGNTIIFGSKNLYHAKCKTVNTTTSDSSNTLMEINNNNGWKNNRDMLVIFCSEIKNFTDNGMEIFEMDDCFNASLQSKSRMSGIKTYLNLVKYNENIPLNTQWYLQPEESLRLMNNTILKINTQGCVNSLSKECKAFFSTHATDGRDGKTPDRYPCFYTSSSSEFVVGKFDPKTTYTMLMITSILPACLFVLSCSSLYFCSKSVGVDEGGHLKVTIMNSKPKGEDPAGNMMDAMDDL